MWLGLAWHVQRLLENLGFSESQAIIKTRKIYDFENWLLRHHLTYAMMMFDPIFDNKYHKYSVSMDEFKLTKISGHWQKHYTWTAMMKVDMKK